MSRILIALTLMTVFVFPAFAAEKKKSCDKPVTIATVDGMVCDFCAQGLIKLFKKNDAVDTVDIDLTTKQVRIINKPGKKLDEAFVRKQVDYSGYTMTSFRQACEKG